MNLEELAKWAEWFRDHCGTKEDDARLTAVSFACRELEKYRLVDDESPPHPCPDFVLRADYRKLARERRKITDAALAACGEGK